VLLYQQPLSPTARARLKIIFENTDGFEIARQDLRICVVPASSSAAASRVCRCCVTPTSKAMPTSSNWRKRLAVQSGCVTDPERAGRHLQALAGKSGRVVESLIGFGDVLLRGFEEFYVQPLGIPVAPQVRRISPR
jgi:hypothetical protein